MATPTKIDKRTDLVSLAIRIIKAINKNIYGIVLLLVVNILIKIK